MTQIRSNFYFSSPFTVKDDIDPDDMCDDGAGSDIDGSETDSKMGDSKKGDSKGGNSKPRRCVFVVKYFLNFI